MQLCCPSKVIVILTYNQSVVMIHYNKDPRRAANICFVTMSPYPQALKCLFEFKFPHLPDSLCFLSPESPDVLFFSVNSYFFPA